MSAEELDLDSSMHSSLSGSPNEHENERDNDDAELFPPVTTNMEAPTTPQNNHLNALAPGELSPPRSQSQPRRSSLPDETDVNFMPVERNGGGGGGALMEDADVQTMFREPAPEIDGSADVTATDVKPGSGWKTKRAQEEYERAMENVVDKDFSLREFGDLFDDPRASNAAK